MPSASPSSAEDWPLMNLPLSLLYCTCPGLALGDTLDCLALGLRMPHTGLLLASFTLLAGLTACAI